MSTVGQVQSPRLAGPADIDRLLSGRRVSHEWPPPGTLVIADPAAPLFVLVVGEPSRGRDGDWFVTTLDGLHSVVGSRWDELLLRAAGWFANSPWAQIVSTVGQWPVIYEVGRGSAMRWISTIVRGTLGGIEQFQFGMQFGNPGADPDPNDSEVAAFAQTLAGYVQSSLADVGSLGAAPLSTITADVVFTEVGAVVKTQTDATNADGTGGNLTYKSDTQWYAYATGAKPTGTAGGNSLPYEVAHAVTFLTDKRGPSGRGRAYVPPMATSAMSNGGKWNPNYAGAWGEFFGRIFDDVRASDGYVPVVVSRRRIILNEIKAIEVGVIPDSQRRRRRSLDEARVQRWVHP